MEYLALVHHLASHWLRSATSPSITRSQASPPIRTPLCLSPCVTSPVSGQNTLCWDLFEHEMNLKREVKDGKRG